MTTREPAPRPPSSAGRARSFISVFAVAALALGGVGAPLLAQPASAAEIPGAITGVNLVETSIPSGLSPMRLEVQFEIGAGIGRGGTAQAGDTFWLQVDPRLWSPNGTFDVYALGSSTDVVARVKMVGGSRATFTLTDYVDNRSFTEGAAFWGVTFRDNTVARGDYDLTFSTDATDFPDSVVVQSTYTPTPGGVSPPLLSGVWQNFEQRRGTWKAILPDGPADTLVIEGFGWTTGPAWEYDCARTLANTNAYRSIFSPVVEISIECRADYVRWELANVPDYASAGLHPTLQIDFDVVDPSRSGDLVFKNSLSYSLDGSAQRGLSGELRQTRGGGALGPTTPTMPTFTQSTCVAGAPSDPQIVLPPNGSGVTYSQNIVDYTAGDTVEVLAELSSGYEWDLPLDPAWNVRSSTVAVYTIVLDDAPGCVLTPVNPAVTQTACSAGTVVDPIITLPAASPGIGYVLDPGVYGPGDTVSIVATLTSTDYVWDAALPAGWTARSPLVAERTVVLDDPSCVTAVAPLAPTVTQTSCSVGTVVLPAVDPAAATAGIRYVVDGTALPGTTVRVVATITGPEYAWVGILPTGWQLVSATEAAYSVTLDPGSCDLLALPSTGLDGAALRGGITAGSLLLLGAAALVAVQLRRRMTRG
ncbi:MAG: hypothetical protein M3Y46_00450 [Actinomycetota bacterium]|nr:hypothetical protein [Actinomycetota bacterium]